MRLRPVNTLAYPAGRALGFNTGHVASKGVILSAVASSSNFVNVLRGSTGSVTGPPVSTMLSSIGPSVDFSGGSTHRINKSGLRTGAHPNATIGVIFQASSVAASHVLFQTATGGGGWALWLNGGATVTLTARAVADVASTLTVAANTPYFLAASVDDAGNLVNFILKNLRTGDVRTQVVASGPTPGSDNGTCIIGNFDTNNLSFKGSIAAVMYSSFTLRMSELLLWSDDPWSFWYPQRVDDNIPTILSFSSGIQGSLSSTLESLSVSSASALKLAGNLSASLAPVTLSGAGTLPIVGSLSSTLGSLTVLSAGTLVSPVLGDLSKTLDSLSVSSTATLKLSASLDTSLGAVSSTSEGAIRISGSLSATLGGLTLSSFGAPVRTATLSVTLGSLTLEATGQEIQSSEAELSVTLGSLTLVSVAYIPQIGASSSFWGAGSSGNPTTASSSFYEGSTTGDPATHSSSSFSSRR